MKLIVSLTANTTNHYNVPVFSVHHHRPDSPRSHEIQLLKIEWQMFKGLDDDDDNNNTNMIYYIMIAN